MKRRSITRRKFLSKVGSSREILQGASAKEPYKEVRLCKMAVIMLPAAFPRQLSLPIWRGGPVPDGTVNGVFILSDRLAQECEINVADLEDEKVMDECIKKLVKAKSDNDASIAQEATAVYKTIMQETVNGLIAESMAQKNEAANYETKVLEEMEKKIAQTKNSRDDTGGLSLTNMETQYLLNRILTIYAGQLTLDTLNEVSGFDKSYYQDGDDEENGEEK